MGVRDRPLLRILVADHHPIIRAGIKALLAGSDPNTNGNMSCLEALASNLGILYDKEPDDFPKSGNLTTALTRLLDAGLAGELHLTAPTLNGKRQTS